MSWTFISSVTTPSECPPPTKPEFAFLGRSNVGKSSLINALAGLNKLAKVSGTPGKTQTINHFLVNDQWYLVDLPGYGYAKTSKSMRSKWSKFIAAYLKERSNLVNLFVLVDIRHPLQAVDKEMMFWFGENGIPFSLVFTKADKLGKVARQKQVTAYLRQLSEFWEPLPAHFITSAEEKSGCDDILADIQRLMPFFKA